MYRSPVPEPLWERIRDEFNLPALEQVRERLSAVHEDPEPVMRQLVRVFLSGLRKEGVSQRPILGSQYVCGLMRFGG